MSPEDANAKLGRRVTWVSSGLEIYYDLVGRPICPNKKKQIERYNFGLHQRLKHIGNCRKFWVCAPGMVINGVLEPSEYHCPTFYVFNQLLEKCEYYE